MLNNNKIIITRIIKNIIIQYYLAASLRRFDFEVLRREGEQENCSFSFKTIKQQLKMCATLLLTAAPSTSYSPQLKVIVLGLFFLFHSTSWSFISCSRYLLWFESAFQLHVRFWKSTLSLKHKVLLSYDILCYHCQSRKEAAVGTSPS